MKKSWLGYLVVALLIGSGVVVPTALTSAASASGRNCGNTVGSRKLPTIDDWPYADTTLFDQFDDMLERHGVKSIQFIISDPTFTRRFPGFQSYTLGRGHHVGGHSVTHRKLTTLSDLELKREIAKSAGGNLFRAPYGVHGPREDRALAAQGKRACDWDIDSGDTSAEFNRLVRAGNDAAAINLLVNNVLRGLRTNPNAKIILFHFKKQSLIALDRIITVTKRSGMQWCRHRPGPATLNVPPTILC